MIKIVRLLYEFLVNAATAYDSYEHKKFMVLSPIISGDAENKIK